MTQFTKQVTQLKKTLRRHKKIVFIAVMFFVLALLLTFFVNRNANNKPQAQNTSVVQPALSVEVVRPVQSEVVNTLILDGKITAAQEAILSAQGAGLKVAQVHVQVGDVVRAGQTLVTFESTTVQGEIAQLSASEIEAKALLIDAEINAEKAEQLKSAGAISDVQYRQYKTNLIAAQARVNAAQKALNAGQIRNTLKAPSAGVVSSKSVNMGAVVQPGQELFRLVVDNRLEWQAELTEGLLGQIKVGATVLVRLEDNSEMSGVVRQIAPTINTSTNTSTVYVRLQGQGRARAGMFATGRITQATGTSLSFLLPQSAVMVRDGFSYVYKVTGDSKTQLAKVQTGTIQNNQIAIVSGVGEQDAIVVSGVGFLKDGDLVKVVN